jgi:cysteine desulfurase
MFSLRFILRHRRNIALNWIFSIDEQKKKSLSSLYFEQMFPVGRVLVREQITFHLPGLGYSLAESEERSFAVLTVYLVNGFVEFGIALTFGRRKEILLAVDFRLQTEEHHAALFAGEILEKEGFQVDYLPVNEGGRVEMNALKALLSNDTALVGIMAANNETGVMQPIRECAKLAHEYGAVFFTDAVQFAPYARIDVQELGVDLLSISSHKFYGPKGCGALYIKNGVTMEKLVGGGEQERGMRGGTLNVAAIVGLAEAYALTCKEMGQTGKKLRALTQAFLQELSTLQGLTRNGEGIDGIINLRIDGVENTALLYKMDLLGVCFAAGSACASASVKPSHVLTAMGLSDDAAKQSVRISFGKTNTIDQAQKAAQLLAKTVKELRKF